LRASTLRERPGGSTRGSTGGSPSTRPRAALHLDELPLPRYEPSFERMDALQRQLSPLWALPAPPYHREQLYLSFLRTTAFIAVDQEKGSSGATTCPARSPGTTRRAERIRARSAESEPRSSAPWCDRG
jgi:hypothetical protein